MVEGMRVAVRALMLGFRRQMTKTEKSDLINALHKCGMLCL